MKKTTSTTPLPRSYVDWKDLNILYKVRDAVLTARMDDLHSSVKELTLREIRKIDPSAKRPKTPQALSDAIDASMHQLAHRMREGLRRADTPPQVVEKRIDADKLHLCYTMDQLAAAMGRAFAAQMSGVMKHMASPDGGTAVPDAAPDEPAEKYRVLLAGFMPDHCRNIEAYARKHLSNGGAVMELVELPKDAEITRPLPDRIDGVIYHRYMSHAGYDRVAKKYSGRPVHRVNGTSDATDALMKLYRELRLVPA